MLAGLHRFALATSVALLACSGIARATDALEHANALTRDYIRRTMAQERIPGLQIAVIRDGRVVLSESLGLANVENQVPVTASTLFPLNSATKPLTGVAMAQLAAEGRVALDAPVGRYLDDLPPAWRQVRVRELLAHTSGLPDIVDPQGDLIDADERAAWAATEARAPDAPAGTRFAYNQTNYGLLARIIARQSGMPYDRYMATHQFAVAGMPATRFGDSYDLVPGAATIYSHSPRRSLAPDDGQRMSRWIYAIPYSLWAGGGIQTNAEELSRWIIALTDGRLLPKDALRAMWTPASLADGSAGAWSAGWPVLATGAHRQVAGIGGARAAFVIHPDDGLAIIVLTNLAGANPQRFLPHIAAFYLPPTAQTKAE